MADVASVTNQCTLHVRELVFSDDDALCWRILEWIEFICNSNDLPVDTGLTFALCQKCSRSKDTTLLILMIKECLFSVVAINGNHFTSRRNMLMLVLRAN